MEGITVDGGGGLRVGAGEEKVRDSVLVLRLTFVGTYSLFMDSDQTFHAIVLEYIRLADRPRFLVDAWVALYFTKNNFLKYSVTKNFYNKKTFHSKGIL